MLTSLHISNYALIDQIDIDFDKGFSVLTGETGAGKSIIIGALSLVLGQRAETKYVKKEAKKSVIEAVFEVSRYQLEAIFENEDLDYNHTCVIRREVATSGKSRAFINDTPVSLSVLRTITDRLIDIHSQHENLLLASDDFQLNTLDTFAENGDVRQNYTTAFKRWNSKKEVLLQRKREAEKQRSNLDYLAFQLQQLDDANIDDPNEKEELEQEQERLSHTEEIKHDLQQAEHIFNAEEANVISMLKQLHHALAHASQYVEEASEWAERANSAMIDMNDMSSDIANLQEGLSFDPARLEWIDNRLSTLYALEKKHNVSDLTALVEIREELRGQLDRIENFEEELARLEKRVAEAELELRKCADKLTLSRQKASRPLADTIVKHLQKMEMPNVKFSIDITVAESYTLLGIDEITYLFTANKNRPLMPVIEIASGGEISRLMLALKALFVEKSALPTIIFDEIDTGVSGETAYRMGELMQYLSHQNQVITISHLPQIATKAQHHFFVYKNDVEETTQTFIKKLSHQERIEEIATLMSGKNPSRASLQNAQEMLEMNGNS